MSTPTTNNNAGPNWYADPADPRSERYWDGTAWTEHRRPALGEVAPPATASNALSIVTMVMAALAFLASPLIFGVIGLGTGLIAQKQGEPRAILSLQILGIAALAGWALGMLVQFLL